MSQEWNKKATRRLATRARKRAAPEVQLPTPQPYDSPITYTRLKFMQDCARAQNTQGKYQFLPEGAVEDELQEDWYQIIDEAVGSFELRFVCREVSILASHRVSPTKPRCPKYCCTFGLLICGTVPIPPSIGRGRQGPDGKRIEGT